MPNRPGPAWLYANTTCLDIRKLIELGADRPVWTNHFCTWHGFAERVHRARCGDPTLLASAHGWYSDADYELALAESKARTCRTTTNG